MTEVAPWINAVRSSHQRFVDLVGSLSADQVEEPSYAAEWSIAQTASHLGSQAEIFQLFLDSGLSGQPAPGGDVFGPIWDRWNGLTPQEQAAQSISANEALVTRLENIPAAEQDSFHLSMFGMELDLAGLAAMRLNEHALHTWDIAVALDPDATVAADAVELLVDQLPQSVGRAGHAVADLEPVSIVTTSPKRTFLLTVSPDVALESDENVAADVVTLPAEALLRLVAGRLDPEHTPQGVSDERLPALRDVFPGY